MARIVVLYNSDYETEAGNPDAASVRDAARAVGRGLTEAGHDIEMVPLRGREVFEVLSRIAANMPDLLFNLCESMEGDPRNEPTFAGLLDLFEIPYTGADLLALATCLFKYRTKDVLVAHRIDTPPYRYIRTQADLADPTLAQLDYPYFVKLVHEDASIGITEANVCHDVAALGARSRELMAAHHQGVIAERYIEGREINVTLLGSADNVEVLPLHEIDFAAMPSDRPHIVSYAAKWDENHVDYAGTKSVPVRDMPRHMSEKIEQVARAAWRAVGLRDYGRVDLRIEHSTPWVIDVNPNPDISPDAGVSRAAAAAGMSYPQLVGKIAEHALRRLGIG
jgi:D-alanine-D-alanine ligase